MVVAKNAKRRMIMSLVLGLGLTTYVFWHEFKYDTTLVPYSTSDYLKESIIFGPLFTLVFSIIIFAVFTGAREVYKRI